jgi:hypothetical protein
MFESQPTTDFEQPPFPCHRFDLPCPQDFERVGPDQAAAIDSPTCRDIPEVGDRLRAAGVTDIVLIHGTFAGNDIAGLLRGFARFSPRIAGTIQELAKQWVDQLVDEVGNYTTEYAERLDKLVNADAPDSSQAIRIERFHWSGENHHLGRACAVISLLDSILRRNRGGDDRILFLSHSHGGNVLAMMTLLIGSLPSARAAFFNALGTAADHQGDGSDPLAVRHRVRLALQDQDRIDRLPAFDMVTFGTPLRYRWNPGFADRLLHFVQHRPLVAGETARAAMPRSLDDLLHAAAGDYVQHFGINGTDFPPPWLIWNSWRANARLEAMFGPAPSWRKLRHDLSLGQRVSLDGKTFLVDYPKTDPCWQEMLLGHGVYTCHAWLPFHLNRVAAEFYPAVSN